MPITFAIYTFCTYIIGINRVKYLQKGMQLGSLHNAFLYYEFSSFVEIYLSKYLQQKTKSKNEIHTLFVIEFNNSIRM